ncbi:MAG: bifunctional demethylmenaquinone methyltransferase/2-methoxy-6-polyprenyl-1,4-benzoquinol methylase UbiE [Deltaproteobacteria bacterium]|nr:bifunctional demethylmenaquinone methyltransferase/2-methoxy-6-polyprenyl-1,4-benzoquinol methylase UbiE [Deltaproteobacteria bacterium]
MSSKTQTIQDMFTRIAPTYDLLNRTLSARIDVRWRKKAIAYLPEKENLKILDLCAGTLDLSLEILKRFPNAQITALDFSAKMLELGEKKIPADKKSQVKIVVGDAMDLQQNPESFDAVLCGFGMRNVVDNAQSLKEIYQVLKPGGRVIILEFFKPNTLPAKIFNATFAKFILPRVGALLSKDKEAYQYLFNSIQAYSSLEDFLKLLEQKNFKNIQSKNLTGHIASIAVGEKR